MNKTHLYISLQNDIPTIGHSTYFATSTSSYFLSM